MAVFVNYNHDFLTSRSAMSFGTFYEVDDNARLLLANRVTKSEWYVALNELNIASCPSCQAEESIPGWECALQGCSEPLATMFTGELSAKRDEYDDPNVIFLGRELVKSIAAEIDKRTKIFFKQILSEVACEADVWLFDPMRLFFYQASEKGNAAIVLWGG